MPQEIRQALKATGFDILCDDGRKLFTKVKVVAGSMREYDYLCSRYPGLRWLSEYTGTYGEVFGATNTLFLYYGTYTTQPLVWFTLIGSLCAEELRQNEVLVVDWESG